MLNTFYCMPIYRCHMAEAMSRENEQKQNITSECDVVAELDKIPLRSTENLTSLGDR